MFRERLEKTLRDNIDNLLPEIQPGTPLAQVIITVRPEIENCIRKVILITDCKRMHDHLHELRQHVIRPLQEEVLSVWKQEEKLSVSRERVIWSCISKAERQLGGITEVRKSICSEHRELCVRVDRLLQSPELWNVEWGSSDRSSVREDFTDALEQFAERVQVAFSEADESMKKEESDLGKCYSALLQGLNDAKQQSNLSPSDHERLNDELENVKATRFRVSDSLTTHNRWQEAHDKLHELDSFRETQRFRKMLGHYRENWLARLVALVDKELQDAEAQEARSSQPQQAVIAIDSLPLGSSCSSKTDNGSVYNLRRLKKSIASLLQDDELSAFDNMRKPFDDVFYYVDKRTLDEVDRLRTRVVALREWLDAIANRPQKAMSSAGCAG
jgi:hypothetical protein